MTADIARRALLRNGIVGVCYNDVQERAEQVIDLTRYTPKRQTHAEHNEDVVLEEVHELTLWLSRELTRLGVPPPAPFAWARDEVA